MNKTKEIKPISKVEKIIYILSYLPYLYFSYIPVCGINIAIGNSETIEYGLSALFCGIIMYYYVIPIYSILGVAQIIYIIIRHKAFDNMTKKFNKFALGFIMGTVIIAYIITIISVNIN